jgi:hypothetical protein
MSVPGTTVPMQWLGFHSQSCHAMTPMRQLDAADGIVQRDQPAVNRHNLDERSTIMTKLHNRNCVTDQARAWVVPPALQGWCFSLGELTSFAV